MKNEVVSINFMEFQKHQGRIRVRGREREREEKKRGEIFAEYNFTIFGTDQEIKFHKTRQNMPLS